MELSETSREIKEYLASVSGDRDAYLSERDIARKFSLNRSVSRKVLTALEGEGLLRCEPQKGYRLVDYSNTADLTIYRVRCAIESEAARLAASAADREEILRLMLILEDADRVVAASDYPRFVELDDDFHRALVAASHDNMLIRLFDFIRIPSLRTGPYPVGGLNESHRRHRAIFDAVKARDPEGAVRAVTDHLGENSVAVQSTGRQNKETSP